MPDTLHRFFHLILIILLQRDSSLPFCRDIHQLVQSQIASQAMGDMEPLSACLLWLPCSPHGNWASTPVRLPASLLPAPALVTCRPLWGAVLLSPHQAPLTPALTSPTSTACLDFPVSTQCRRLRRWGMGRKACAWLPKGKMVVPKNRIKVVDAVRFVNCETQATVLLIPWPWKDGKFSSRLNIETTTVQMDEDCLPGFQS